MRIKVSIFSKDFLLLTSTFLKNRVVFTVGAGEENIVGVGIFYFNNWIFYSYCIDFALQMAYTISTINLKGADIMANTTNFSVRMDSDIKKQCEMLYAELGVNLTTAINVFLRQSLRAGGFPFDVRLEQPNKETIAAMLEAERLAHDPSVKRYSDVEEALRELKR